MGKGTSVATSNCFDSDQLKGTSSLTQALKSGAMWIREFTLLTLYILPGEATLSAWMAPLLLVARLVCYTTGVAAGIAKYGNSTLDMEVGKLNTTLDMEIEEAPTTEAEDFSVAKILLLGAELVGVLLSGLVFARTVMGCADDCANRKYQMIISIYKFYMFESVMNS